MFTFDINEKFEGSEQCTDKIQNLTKKMLSSMVENILEVKPYQRKGILWNSKNRNNKLDFVNCLKNKIKAKFVRRKYISNYSPQYILLSKY